MQTGADGGDTMAVGTDGWFFPVAQSQDQTGTDIIGQGSPILIQDYISVTIAQANDADGVTVTLVFEQ